MNPSWPRLLLLPALLLAIEGGAQGLPRDSRPRPPLPTVKAPAQVFRELLAASPDQRAVFLAARSEKSRELITAKLDEFAALSPEERELRLRVAQLQFFLSPLLQLEPAARTNLLANVPDDDRPLILERLKAWDALPAETRRDILESERSLSHFVRQPAADPRELAAVVTRAPAAARPEIEAQLRRWLDLTPAERARKTANFQRFFDLTEAERQRTLQQLSTTDRAQMEATLRAFESLPPEQRDRCVRAFRKFAGLSVTERAEFLRNAEKWQAMSAGERSAWRRLVDRAFNQPPLPPPLQLQGSRNLLVATNTAGP